MMSKSIWDICEMDFIKFQEHLSQSGIFFRYEINKRKDGIVWKMSWILSQSKLRKLSHFWVKTAQNWAKTETILWWNCYYWESKVYQNWDNTELKLSQSWGKTELRILKVSTLHHRKWKEGGKAKLWKSETIWKGISVLGKTF